MLFSACGERIVNSNRTKTNINEEGLIEDTNKGSLCTYVLISDRFALTAAHCVENPGSIRDITVTMGHSNWGSNQTVKYKVKYVLIHPKFQHTVFSDSIDPYENDIALLRLSSDLNFTEAIQPIGLPTETYSDDVLLDTNKTKLLVAGWGKKVKLGM